MSGYLAVKRYDSRHRICNCTLSACLSPSVSHSPIDVLLNTPFAIAPAPISHPCITSPTREAKRCLADSGSPNHPIRSTTSTIARCSVGRVWLESPRLMCGTTLHLVRHATPYPPAFCQLRYQRLFNLQTDNSTHDAGIDRGATCRLQPLPPLYVAAERYHQSYGGTTSHRLLPLGLPR